MDFQFTDGAEYRVTAIAYSTRRADAPDRAKHRRHGRGAANAGDDSGDWVLSSRDCVGIGSGSMEPPSGSILTEAASVAMTKT